jgi:serine/threonine protein kinase
MIVHLTRASNNQFVSLTKQIANSGEGEVWKTSLKGYLAKIYHTPTLERIEKLKVMLANPPVDPMLPHNHVSIAWPFDLLKDSSGKYSGFLMPAIQNSRQLSSICNPSRRKKIAPGFNWYYLHVTALNTAWIIQEIHAKGYVLADIKLENILVNDCAMIAVIDTDSFQVKDSQTGKVYRCTVGSEGFTPVELLGKNISTINQAETHDRFRLAILIHYLLFGYHPFSGRWIGSGESPEQTELIRKGYWYKNPYSLIRSSHNTISLNVVHPELKQLFLKCFNDGHTQPHLRPTAENWHNALKVSVNQLTVCKKIDSHHYSRHYGECNWCQRATILGVDIFPDHPPKQLFPQKRQPSSPLQVLSQYRLKIVLAFQRFQNSISSIQTLKQLAFQKIRHRYKLTRSDFSDLLWFVVGVVGLTIILGFTLGWYWVWEWVILPLITCAFLLGIRQGLILILYAFFYEIEQGIKLVRWLIREVTTKIIYPSLLRSRKKIYELIRKLIKFLKTLFF